MRISVYISPLRRVVSPTGVGQHTRNMIQQLNRRQELQLTLLATRQDHALAKQGLGSASGAAVSYLPPGERFWRALLMMKTPLSIDRWSGPSDWIYCPKEQPVATRAARLAVTVHDVLPFEQELAWRKPTGWYSRLRWHTVMRRIAERASLIATVSEFTRQRLLALFPEIRRERTVVVGNGVSDVYFRAAGANVQEVQQRFGIDAGRPYVMAIGSLTHRKGGPTLIRLAKQIRRKGLDLEVLVTGRRHSADLVEALEREQRESKIPLRLLGYVSDADQAALLHDAVAMAFPSRYEGFGMPVLEAMAAGTVAISSRATALPEVGGDAPIYIGGESGQELLEAIVELQRSPELRRRHVQLGALRAGEFTWERCAERLLAAMRS